MTYDPNREPRNPYDPNREPRNVNILSRDGGMWGWTLGIVAVVVLGLIFWAAMDPDSPQVADKAPAPVTQPAQPPSTVGSAPADNTGNRATPAAPARQPGGANPPDNAKQPAGASQPDNAKQ